MTLAVARPVGGFWRAVLLAACASLAPVSAATAQAVVQPLPNPAVQRLNDALRRLAQNPQALDTLIEAGQASVALEDIEAALGFYRRAEAVAPYDGRVKAGLAAVMVRQQQPVEALRLFAEAEQAGEPMRLHAAERGLAYDLVGDNAHAQQDYFVFLSLADDASVRQRLALSQAIAGDQRASEATLLPLLQRSDLSAYRTRAFALAILGKPEEAVSIAETMLPERLSSRIAPYLRYMPRLTRPQQAAAANLGVFPAAAQIGRDDPALAAYAPQGGARAAAGSADARLVPSGQPLGSREGGIPRREDTPVVRAAQQVPAPPPPVELAPAIVPPQPQPQLVVAQAEPPPLAQAADQPPAQVVLAQAQVPVPPIVQSIVPSPEPMNAASSAANEPVTVALLSTAETDVPRPSISVDSPSALATPAQEPPAPRDLSQAFAEFTLPAGPSAPAAGAVDITTIQPRREAPRVTPAATPAAKPAPPPKPFIPSRHWVQVATGKDTKALAFDWRRVKREAGGLLDRAAPHVAKWGQTNRLIAGPFASAKQADELIAKLKGKKIDSFRFTSEQGEEVKPLG